MPTRKPTNQIDLSIIIISYNTKDITENCLNSIFSSMKNSDISYEIVVVDNNSSDGSVLYFKELQKKHSNITIIFNKDNTGFAIANNQGAKAAKGSHLLFLNSDTIVLDDAIDKLMHYFDQNQTIHFLGPKLLNKDMSPQASCGPAYNLFNIFIFLFLRGDYWGATRSSPDATKEVDWVSGACILTKKAYFDQINGFDEGIFMYMDEIDLLYRAQKHGFHIFFYPEARIIHLGSASSGGKTFPILQVYKGYLYFYKKHYDKLSLYILKLMLKLKAGIAIVIGKLTHNSYLINTYGQAQKLVTMD